MNIKRLKALEAHFLNQYPGGFDHPEMIEIGKKHNMSKMIEFVQTELSKDSFHHTEKCIEAIKKAITRSSMVSVFEKMKFKDFLKVLHDDEKESLKKSLYELLHGNKQKGFELFLGCLEKDKLAKWTLVSIIPNYFKPKKEVFVKPTTVKNIIKFLELDLVYHPKPTWDFYEKYRTAIDTMKKEVDPRLSLSNAVFSGFLMMSMK